MIPAIDVRGGRCVRLLRGDYARETVYADDPAEMAERFAGAGAARVHVVDLDSARGAPDPGSRAAILRVVRTLADAGVAVELGGGVRDRAAAAAWLDAGVSWVVLGSLAVRNPELAEAVCRAHPDRVLLGLDVRGSMAQAQGWTEDAGSADAVLDRWATWPAAGVIRTDVERDGALGGPDLDGLRACVSRYPGPVIASGGVASLADLEACAAAGAAGAIAGRALYEGRLDLGEALRAFPPRRPAVP